MSIKCIAKGGITKAVNCEALHQLKISIVHQDFSIGLEGHRSAAVEDRQAGSSCPKRSEKILAGRIDFRQEPVASIRHAAQRENRAVGAKSELNQWLVDVVRNSKRRDQ